MSKAVRLDHEFNQHRFVYLLEQAKGNRSQTEFAKESGLSVAYICKYLNHAFDAPPIPSTIKKIAAVAANGVTYEELMEAAGYDPSKYINKLQPIKMDNTDIPSDSLFEKQSIMTITSALSNSNLKWSVKGISKNDYFDLFVEIKNNRITNWYFIFITALSRDEYYFNGRLSAIYGRLVLLPTETCNLYSIVTDSEKLYEYIIDNPPTSLAMYVSVILIDTSNLVVLKHEYAKTAYSKPLEDIPSLIKEKA